LSEKRAEKTNSKTKNASREKFCCVGVVDMVWLPHVFFGLVATCFVPYQTQFIFFGSRSVFSFCCDISKLFDNDSAIQEETPLTARRSDSDRRKTLLLGEAR
jgi:hypothetical protein